VRRKSETKGAPAEGMKLHAVTRHLSNNAIAEPDGVILCGARRW